MSPELKYWRVLGLKFPLGWKSLGRVKTSYYVGQNGETYEKEKVHLLCRTILNVGNKNGKLFYYCPMCGIEVNGITEEALR